MTFEGRKEVERRLEDESESLAGVIQTDESETPTAAHGG